MTADETKTVLDWRQLQYSPKGFPSASKIARQFKIKKAVVENIVKEYTQFIPVIGYFSRESPPFEHQLPVALDIPFDKQFKEWPGGEDKPLRQFSSFLTSTLAFVRDKGPTRMYYGLPEANEYLEAHKYVEAIQFRVDSPLFGEVEYKITEKGLEFLRKYEAPECWSW